MTTTVNVSTNVSAQTQLSKSFIRIITWSKRSDENLNGELTS